MRPVQFNAYKLRESGDEFRFIGYGQLLHDEGETEDVCIMAPSVSGYDLGAARFKKTDEHTIYFLVVPAEFEKHFEEGEK